MKAVLATILGLATLACGGGGEPATPPNVLLVTLDTTRADFLGSYGHPGDPTPRIDAVAAEGVLFERTAATSAATPISHASILTGLNPYRHGVRVISAASGFRLDASIPTLTTLLKAQGYATAAVHSSFTVSGTFGFGHGFDHFDDLDTRMTPVAGEPFVDWNVAAFQRRADETSQRVLPLLEALPEPFFLWIHYWDPHDEARLPPPEFLRADLPRQPDGRPERATDALYGEEVRFMDAQLGRVVDRLRELGRYDRTITVITADHGQGLSDGLRQHGWRGHRMVYHQQIDVPLILRVPGRAGGRRVPDLVRITDILPTLLDLLGLEGPQDLDGASLVPLMEGRADPAAPRLAYADQLNGYDWNARMLSRNPDADFLYSVSDGRWKLIYRPTRPEASEFYAIDRDPREEQDLAAAHPEELERLLVALARLEPWVDRPFPAGEGGGEGGLSPAEREALVALGYVEDPADRGAAGPAWGWRCPSGGPVEPEPGTCDAQGTPRVLVALPAAGEAGREGAAE